MVLRINVRNSLNDCEIYSCFSPKSYRIKYVFVIKPSINMNITETFLNTTLYNWPSFKRNVVNLPLISFFPANIAKLQFK